MDRLGIIGGLGPMATAFFLEKMIAMTDASTDQEHVNAIVYHEPATPDRTAFILDRNAPDPGPFLIETAKRLEKDGVSAIAIPCVTAHYFRDRIGEAVKIPVFNGVAQTAAFLEERKVSRVGIMATDGTVASGLFQTEFDPSGISCIFPDALMQKKVMALIYDYVKAGREEDLSLYREVSEALYADGAEVVLLGCTELSVIGARHALPGRYVDVLDVLAMHCVDRFARLKKGVSAALLQ